MKSPRDKYQNDNHYHALVDMMVAHIHQCNYTPSEMREAAILASIIYEQTIIRRYDFPTTPKAIEDALKITEEWIDKET